MKPDASQYNPDPAYMRDLVLSSGLSQPALGRVIGKDERTIRNWIKGTAKFDYPSQFAVECVVLLP